MRILFVTPAPPFPPSDGARLIVANLAAGAFFPTHALSRQFCRTKWNCGGHARMVCRDAYRALAVREQNGEMAQELPGPSANVGPGICVRTNARDAPRVCQAPQHRRCSSCHCQDGGYADAVTPIPTVLAPHDSLSRLLEQWQTTGPAVRDLRMRGSRWTRCDVMKRHNISKEIVYAWSRRRNKIFAIVGSIARRACDPERRGYRLFCSRNGE